MSRPSFRMIVQKSLTKYLSSKLAFSKDIFKFSLGWLTKYVQRSIKIAFFKYIFKFSHGWFVNFMCSIVLWSTLTSWPEVTSWPERSQPEIKEMIFYQHKLCNWESVKVSSKYTKCFGAENCFFNLKFNFFIGQVWHWHVCMWLPVAVHCFKVLNQIKSNQIKLNQIKSN